MNFNSSKTRKRIATIIIAVVIIAMVLPMILAAV